jgi:hypothetical protein
MITFHLNPFLNRLLKKRTMLLHNVITRYYCHYFNAQTVLYSHLRDVTIIIPATIILYSQFYYKL